MSLIKEALDKVQEEGARQQGEPPADQVPADEGDPRPDQPTQNESGGQHLDLSTVLTSAVILILAVLIGGQIVLLISMMVF